MFQRICAFLALISFALSSINGAYAANWRHIYNLEIDPLSGILDDHEIAGMAYLRVPFGGPAHARQGDISYGLSLISRLPDQYGHLALGGRRGLATLMDMRFNGGGISDLRVNGLSVANTYRRLNAAGDDGPSGWITYGIMAIAIGAAAIVIVAESDKEAPPLDPPPDPDPNPDPDPAP